MSGLIRDVQVYYIHCRLQGGIEQVRGAYLTHGKDEINTEERIWFGRDRRESIHESPHVESTQVAAIKYIGDIPLGKEDGPSVGWSL